MAYDGTSLPPHGFPSVYTWDSQPPQQWTSGSIVPTPFLQPLGHKADQGVGLFNIWEQARRQQMGPREEQ
eukprot:3060418-Karenia_brevis.AAC.1